jgi:hypothetical protein
MTTFWTMHRECRVFALEDQFAAIWSRKDLNDTSNNIPNMFFGTLADAQGNLDPDRGLGILMEDVPMDRDEPFLVPHPGVGEPILGILAWTDQRTYVDIENGRIELHVAPVSQDLTIGQSVIFSHAWFIAGTSQLNATLVGTNVYLLWRDERHGSGIIDPKPEVWFETAWY